MTGWTGRRRRRKKWFMRKIKATKLLDGLRSLNGVYVTAINFLHNACLNLPVGCSLTVPPALAILSFLLPLANKETLGNSDSSPVSQPREDVVLDIPRLHSWNKLCVTWATFFGITFVPRTRESRIINSETMLRTVLSSTAHPWWSNRGIFNKIRREDLISRMRIILKR